jgi:two-component system sensor histidine kinase RegB
MKEYLPIFNIDPNTTPKATSITFVWLLHLRWGAIFSQLVLIYMVGFYLKIDIPIVLVSSIISFEIISNLTFFYLKKKHLDVKEWLFGAIMFIDVVLLTILLLQTGGAMNPFTFLYLLHVVIGAILMRPVLAWILGIFTILCYSFLFLPPEHLNFLSGTAFKQEAIGPICIDVATIADETDNNMKIHLKGMLVAFAITTIFIVFFIGRIRRALDDYYETVEHLKGEMVKNEKLAALATLAAGAAHEFSTPLSTIAVAAGEMLHFCNKHDVDDELVDDVFLIKDQVAVCKEILDQLSSDSGAARGDQLTKFSTIDLVEDIKEFMPNSAKLEVKVGEKAHDLQLTAPYLTIFKAIKGLIKNGCDASPLEQDQLISLNISTDEKHLVIAIKDQGTGMDAETQLRAVEPFFTTKAPGEGMGLGLFLAQSIAERFGGDLTIESVINKGTNIRMRLALKEIGA